MSARGEEGERCDRMWRAAALVRQSDNDKKHNKVNEFFMGSACKSKLMQ